MTSVNTEKYRNAAPGWTLPARCSQPWIKPETHLQRYFCPSLPSPQISGSESSWWGWEGHSHINPPANLPPALPSTNLGLSYLKFNFLKSVCVCAHTSGEVCGLETYSHSPLLYCTQNRKFLPGTTTAPSRWRVRTRPRHGAILDWHFALRTWERNDVISALHRLPAQKQHINKYPRLKHIRSENSTGHIMDLVDRTPHPHPHPHRGLLSTPNAHFQSSLPGLALPVGSSALLAHLGHTCPLP